ncbi:MAG TPA: hypothetical protein VFL73_01485 [Solirubrobacteraceae bacterium]|jgi:hypothetical protein|nr:hypothetical protein [Solirubrobacteraceae bacterium]
MTQTESDAALEAFTMAMLASCGQLSLIVDHMHRFAAEGGVADEAPPLPVALHNLIRDVLERLAADHDVTDIATAAQMLESATRIVGDELFFVDLSRLEDGQ